MAFGRPQIAAHQWDDTPKARSGDGISRPARGARTKTWTVLVFPVGGQPFKWTTKAEHKTAAIKYAQARWPGSTAEIL